jgi:hypothetical protein
VTAKRLVERSILENSTPIGKSILIHSACHDCGAEASRELRSGTFTGAALEYSIDRFKADVVGFGAGGVALVVEILHTHAIPQQKASALSVRWVELRATDVIADPVSWRPVRAKLRPIDCVRCEAASDRVHVACKKAGIPPDHYSVSKRDHHKARYVANAIECYGCREEIPVFWWLGVPYCSKPPPEPRPRTLQLRQSQTYGAKYWANTCPYCRRIQGDNFLFCELGAPFGNLPLREIPETRHSVRSVLRHLLLKNFGE